MHAARTYELDTDRFDFNVDFNLTSWDSNAARRLIRKDSG
jgi:hypothetical protein